MRKTLLLFVAAFFMLGAGQGPGVTNWPAGGPREVFNMTGGADGVVATGCPSDLAASPTVCTAGSGTDNSVQFASLVDTVAARGGGTIHFPYAGTGIYRGAFVVDEDNIKVTCAPGVRLMPVAADTDGGQVMNVVLSGDFVDKFHIEGCWLFEDDPAGHGHKSYAYATVDAPTGVTGTNSTAVDYAATVCVGTCGAGDDITIGGTFDGAATAITASVREGVQFEFKIVAEGTPDTFQWRRNSGHWRATQNVSSSAITLVDGLTVLWAGTDNHTAADIWTSWQTPEAQTHITMTGAHNLTGGETIEIIGAVPTSYNDTYIIHYVDADELTIRKTFVSLTTPGTWRRVPGIGEAVSWADPGGQCTGACGGDVARYDEANDLLFIAEDDGDNWSNGDDVTDGNWTAANTAAIVNETAANMDGLVLDGCRDCAVDESNTFSNFGGNSLYITGSTNESFITKGLLVDGNNFRECPSIPSKDACIDFSQADNVTIRDNDIDCGVMAGFALQYCVSLASATGVDTIAATNIFFEDNLIYDNDAEDSQGGVDKVDGGLIIQPNATGVDYDNIHISGGYIDVDHNHLDTRVATAATGSLFLGASGGKITNLVVGPITLKGSVDLDSNNPDNTVIFSDFQMSSTYGDCLVIEAATGKVGPGVLRDCGGRGVSVASLTGDYTFTDVEVLDTGSGATSNNDDAHVQIAASFTGTFQWNGGRIVGAPSTSQSLSGFDCNGAAKTYINDVDILRVEVYAAEKCQEMRGGFWDTTNFGTITGANGVVIRGVTVQSPQNTVGTARACFDLDHDEVLVSDTKCYSDATAAITEAGDRNYIIGNFSADSDGSATGGTWVVDGTGSFSVGNYALGGVVPNMVHIQSGDAPTQCRFVGELYLDINEGDDTNCTTTLDNSICACTAIGTPGTWASTE